MHIDDQYTDKIFIPESILISWTFDVPDLFEKFYQVKLVNPANGITTHCGWRAADKEEIQSIVLPDWMMQNLQLQDGTMVDISLVKLPIASYISFEPESKYFNIDFPDDEQRVAVLTKALSDNKFTCLTVGDKIPIRAQDETYFVHVSYLGCGEIACEAVCLINNETFEMEAQLHMDPSRRQLDLRKYKMQQMMIKSANAGNPEILQQKIKALRQKYNYHPEVQELKDNLRAIQKQLKSNPQNPSLLQKKTQVQKLIAQKQDLLPKSSLSVQPVVQQDKMTKMLRMAKNMVQQVILKDTSRNRRPKLEKFLASLEKLFPVEYKSAVQQGKLAYNLDKMELEDKLMRKFPTMKERELQIAVCVNPSDKELEMHPNFYKWIQRELRAFAFNKR